MIKKILAILAAIGGVLSAVFYVLFKQSTEQKKAAVEENKDLKDNLDAVKAADEAVTEVRKQNEELVEKAHSGNNLDAFYAINELLSK